MISDPDTKKQPELFIAVTEVVLLLFTGREHDSLPRGAIGAPVEDRPAAWRVQGDAARLLLPARHLPSRRKGQSLILTLAADVSDHMTIKQLSLCVLQLFVNDAQINASNILSSKGVIHGLSAVLHINRNRCDIVSYKNVLVKSSSTGQLSSTAETVKSNFLCLSSQRDCVSTVFTTKTKPAPTTPSQT